MTWLVGQAADPGPIAEFLQFGVLGAVVIAVILGWLWPKPGVEALKADKELADTRAVRADERADRAEARADRAEQQRDALAREMQTSLAVLTETTAACQRMLPLLQEMLRDEHHHRQGRPRDWG